MPLHPHSTNRAFSFAIGYIYSFIAAGLFYWGLMKWFPHTPSMLSEPNTGEDIIAASDEKQLAAGTRKHQKSIRDYLRSKNRTSSV
jgi:NCS1 family nucleobase:cation symporter-1